MTGQAEIKVRLEALLETLSDIEHERWSHWQRYMHSKGQVQPDGSLLLPSELVCRWQKQMNTPYQQLTEQEKESDREQVRKYLALLIETLSDDS